MNRNIKRVYARRRPDGSVHCRYMIQHIEERTKGEGAEVNKPVPSTFRTQTSSGLPHGKNKPVDSKPRFACEECGNFRPWWYGHYCGRHRDAYLWDAEIGWAIRRSDLWDYREANKDGHCTSFTRKSRTFLQRILGLEAHVECR
jgi:hypothetical protein